MRDLTTIKVVFDSEYFHELRKEKKLKIRDLAHLTGLNERTLHRCSSGVTDNFSSETVYKLAIVLDVLVEDLLKEVKV